jgi:hypothetical protein
MGAQYVLVADAVTARSPVNPSAVLTIGTSVTPVVAANDRRKSMVLNNVGGADILIGPAAGLTSSLYFARIPAGKQVQLTEADAPDAAWSAVVASGSGSLVVGEVLSDSATPAEA